jgi:hypothetical protein
MVIGRENKKVYLVAVGALVVVVLLLLYLLISNSTENNTKDTEILKEETRTSVQLGNCSNEELLEIQSNTQNYAETLAEETALKDLANCHVFRNEYNEAVNVYKTLEALYADNEDAVAAESTRMVIANIEATIALPSESPEEVETDEPLAN